MNIMKSLGQEVAICILVLLVSISPHCSCDVVGDVSSAAVTSALNTEAAFVVEKLVHHPEMQKLLDMHPAGLAQELGRSRVNEITSALTSFMSRRSRVVYEMKKRLESRSSSYGNEKFDTMGCISLSGHTLKYFSRSAESEVLQDVSSKDSDLEAELPFTNQEAFANQPVSSKFSRSVVNFGPIFSPEDAYLDRDVASAVCLSQELETLIDELQNSGTVDTSELKWTYFADTKTGISRWFPGFSWDRIISINQYDPRIRPWYVHGTGASGMSKRIVFVIDASSAMGEEESFGEEGRKSSLAMAKSAISSVINTLTDVDACNVVVASPEGVQVASHWPRQVDNPRASRSANQGNITTAELASLLRAWMLSQETAIKSEFVDDITETTAGDSGSVPLVAMTPGPRTSMKAFVDAIEASSTNGVANFTQALLTAFRILADANSVGLSQACSDGSFASRLCLPCTIENNCEAQVVFVSNGYSSDQSSWSWIKQASKAVNARLFTFGIGPKVHVKGLQRLACAGRGQFSFVRSGGDSEILQKDLAKFQNHFRLIGKSFNNLAQYSEPYIDGLGLGLMITIAAPLYEVDGSLFGVVATDVLLPELVAAVTSRDTALSYAFMVDRLGQALVHPSIPKQIRSDDLRGDGTDHVSLSDELPVNPVQISTLESERGNLPSNVMAEILEQVMLSSSPGSLEVNFVRRRALRLNEREVSGLIHDDATIFQGVVEESVNVTVFWSPVFDLADEYGLQNSEFRQPFSVIYVLDNRDKNKVTVDISINGSLIASSNICGITSFPTSCVNELQPFSSLSSSKVSCPLRSCWGQNSDAEGFIYHSSDNYVRQAGLSTARDVLTGLRKVVEKKQQLIESGFLHSDRAQALYLNSLPSFDSVVASAGAIKDVLSFSSKQLSTILIVKSGSEQAAKSAIGGVLFSETVYKLSDVYDTIAAPEFQISGAVPSISEASSWKVVTPAYSVPWINGSSHAAWSTARIIRLVQPAGVLGSTIQRSHFTKIFNASIHQSGCSSDASQRSCLFINHVGMLLHQSPTSVCGTSDGNGFPWLPVADPDLATAMINASVLIFRFDDRSKLFLSVNRDAFTSSSTISGSFQQKSSNSASMNTVTWAARLVPRSNLLFVSRDGLPRFGLKSTNVVCSATSQREGMEKVISSLPGFEDMTSQQLDSAVNSITDPTSVFQRATISAEPLLRKAFLPDSDLKDERKLNSSRCGLGQTDLTIVFVSLGVPIVFLLVSYILRDVSGMNLQRLRVRISRLRMEMAAIDASFKHLQDRVAAGELSPPALLRYDLFSEYKALRDEKIKAFIQLTFLAMKESARKFYRIEELRQGVLDAISDVEESLAARILPEEMRAMQNNFDLIVGKHYSTDRHLTRLVQRLNLLKSKRDKISDQLAEIKMEYYVHQVKHWFIAAVFRMHQKQMTRAFTDDLKAAATHFKLKTHMKAIKEGGSDDPSTSSHGDESPTAKDFFTSEQGKGQDGTSKQSTSKPNKSGPKYEKNPAELLQSNPSLPGSAMDVALHVLSQVQGQQHGDGHCVGLSETQQQNMLKRKSSMVTLFETYLTSNQSNFSSVTGLATVTESAAAKRATASAYSVMARPLEFILEVASKSHTQNEVSDGRLPSMIEGQLMQIRSALRARQVNEHIMRVEPMASQNLAKSARPRARKRQLDIDDDVSHVDLALIFMNDAKNGNFPRLTRLKKGPLAVYWLLTNAKYRAFMSLVCLFHMYLLYEEWPRNTETALSFTQSIIFNCVCTSLHVGHVLMQSYSVGLDEMFDNNRWITLLTVFLTALDIPFAFLGISRITRALRSFLMIIYQPSLQREFKKFLSAIPSVLDIILLLGFLLAVFSLIVQTMFDGLDAGDLFSSAGSTLKTLYIFIGGENHPDVIATTFGENRWMVTIFLVIYIILGIVVMSLATAAIFDAYLDKQHLQIMTKMLRERVSLYAAFFVLDTDEGGTISLDEWMEFAQQMLPNERPERLQVMFMLLESTGNYMIDANEWFDLTDVLDCQVQVPSWYSRLDEEEEGNSPRKIVRQASVHVKETLMKTHDTVSGLVPVWLTMYLEVLKLKIRDTIENSWAYRAVFITLVSSNLLLQFFLREVPAISYIGRWHLMSSISIAIVSFFFLEMAAKFFTFGFVGYFKQPWNRFDFIVVGLSIVTFLDDTQLSSQTRVIVRFVSLFVIFRVIRLVYYVPRYNALVSVLFRIFPAVLRVLVFISLVAYCYLAIGLESFHNTYSAPAFRPTFNSAAEGTMVIFQMITGEAWQDVMARGVYSSNYVLNIVQSLYFISFHFFISTILLDLLIACFLEYYGKEEQAFFSEHDRSERAKAVLEHLDAATIHKHDAQDTASACGSSADGSVAKKGFKAAVQAEAEKRKGRIMSFADAGMVASSSKRQGIISRDKGMNAPVANTPEGSWVIQPGQDSAGKPMPDMVQKPLADTLITVELPDKTLERRHYILGHSGTPVRRMRLEMKLLDDVGGIVGRNLVAIQWAKMKKQSQNENQMWLKVANEINMKLQEGHVSANTLQKEKSLFEETHKALLKIKNLSGMHGTQYAVDLSVVGLRQWAHECAEMDGDSKSHSRDSMTLANDTENTTGPGSSGASVPQRSALKHQGLVHSATTTPASSSVAGTEGKWDAPTSVFAIGQSGSEQHPEPVGFARISEGTQEVPSSSPGMMTVSSGSLDQTFPDPVALHQVSQNAAESKSKLHSLPEESDHSDASSSSAHAQKFT